MLHANLLHQKFNFHHRIPTNVGSVKTVKIPCQTFWFPLKKRRMLFFKMLFDFCTFGYYFWSSKYLKVSSEMLLIFGAAARSKWGGGESISATSTGHRQDSVLLFSFVTQGLKIKSESRHSHLLLNSRFNLNYGGICRRCWHWCKILQIMEATRWRFFNLSWVFFICQEFCGIPSLSPWWQRLWGLGVEPQHDKKGWIK